MNYNITVIYVFLINIFLIFSILLELETTEDPVWHYLDSQYKFIIDLLKESYKEQLSKIEGLLSKKFLNYKN